MTRSCIYKKLPSSFTEWLYHQMSAQEFELLHIPAALGGVGSLLTILMGVEGDLPPHDFNVHFPNDQ